MVMLLAERLTKTSAPASAAVLEGGIGVQRSSQISTWKVSATEPVEANRRSTPNGALWPAISIRVLRMPAPEVKCRRS